MEKLQLIFKKQSMKNKKDAEGKNDGIHCIQDLTRQAMQFRLKRVNSGMQKQIAINIQNIFDNKKQIILDKINNVKDEKEKEKLFDEYMGYQSI